MQLMESLENQKTLSESRLVNAEQLLSLLQNEGVRWKEIILEIDLMINHVVGDVFISVSYLNYLAPFTG